jgi:hypothetical protein
MQEETAMMESLCCETCKFSKITTKNYDDFGDITEIFCTKINRDIDLLTCGHPHWFFDVGCASHSKVFLYLPLSEDIWELLNQFNQEKTPEQIIKEALLSYKCGDQK